MTNEELNKHIIADTDQVICNIRTGKVTIFNQLKDTLCKLDTAYEEENLSECLLHTAIFRTISDILFTAMDNTVASMGILHSMEDKDVVLDRHVWN